MTIYCKQLVTIVICLLAGNSVLVKVTANPDKVGLGKGHLLKHFGQESQFSSKLEIQLNGAQARLTLETSSGL